MSVIYIEREPRHDRPALSRIVVHDVCCIDKLEGFDHGVGHSLLLLYDAKVPNGQNSKEFNDLVHDPSTTSMSLFYIMTKYFIFISI